MGEVAWFTSIKKPHTQCLEIGVEVLEPIEPSQCCECSVPIVGVDAQNKLCGNCRRARQRVKQATTPLAPIRCEQCGELSLEGATSSLGGVSTVEVANSWYCLECWRRWEKNRDREGQMRAAMTVWYRAGDDIAKGPEGMENLIRNLHPVAPMTVADGLLHVGVPSSQAQQMDLMYKFHLEETGAKDDAALMKYFGRKGLCS